MSGQTKVPCLPPCAWRVWAFRLNCWRSAHAAAYSSGPIASAACKQLWGPTLPGGLGGRHGRTDAGHHLNDLRRLHRGTDAATPCAQSKRSSIICCRQRCSSRAHSAARLLGGQSWRDAHRHPCEVLRMRALPIASVARKSDPCLRSMHARVCSGAEICSIGGGGRSPGPAGGYQGGCSRVGGRSGVVRAHGMYVMLQCCSGCLP